MDPLSISASVAGLLALAGTIIGKGSTYIRSVRDYPKALINLLSETERLDAILRQIHELAQGISTTSKTTQGISTTSTTTQGISTTSTTIQGISTTSTTISNQLGEIITPEIIRQADTLLKSVKLKLEECERIQDKKGKKSINAIIWPFQERAVNSTLEEFRRLATTLGQAIIVDSRYCTINLPVWELSAGLIKAAAPYAISTSGEMNFTMLPHLP